MADIDADPGRPAFGALRERAEERALPPKALKVDVTVEALRAGRGHEPGARALWIAVVATSAGGRREPARTNTTARDRTARWRARIGARIGENDVGIDAAATPSVGGGR